MAELVLPIMLLMALLGLGFILSDDSVLTFGTTARYNLSINASDYSFGDSGKVHNQTTLRAVYNGGIDPPVWDTAYTEINTSGIPDDTVINWANFTYYVQSYTATVGVVKEYATQIFNSTNGVYDTIAVREFTSAGWTSDALDEHNLLLINKTWNTTIRIIVFEPCAGDSMASPEGNVSIDTESINPGYELNDVSLGAGGGGSTLGLGCSRTMLIRAREYPTSPTFGSYLMVNYGS